MTTTAIASATRPMPKKIRSRLFMSQAYSRRRAHLISQQSAVAVQAGDIIADGLDARRDRNGQQQPDATPDSAPEHQRNRYHQRIQVYARTDHFRVQQVH